MLLFKAATPPVTPAAESSSSSSLTWIIIGVSIAVAVLLIAAGACLYRRKHAHAVHGAGQKANAVVEMSPQVASADVAVIVDSIAYPAVRLHMGSQGQLHSPLPSPSVVGGGSAFAAPLSPIAMPGASESASSPVPAHVASESKNRVHVDLFTILDSLSSFALTPSQQSRAQVLVSQLHSIVGELLAMPRDCSGLEFAPMSGGFGANPATPGPAAVQRIDAGSPAAQLGGLVALGDQIVAIEGVPVQSAAHASFLLSKSLLVLPGQTAELSLLRGSADSLAPRVAVRASLPVHAAAVSVPPVEVHARLLMLQQCLQSARQLTAECAGQAH